jgi:tripartite-type tricarboxylate transporter receptor subunit TctC
MKLPRRKVLQLASVAATAPLFSRAARAQAYPTRPVTLIVPFAVGGPTDVGVRIVAQRMASSLGQPIIIENVTGADGSIGVGRAARARPDGYTINISVMSSQVLNGAFYSLPYDLVNDFEPIFPLVITPIVFLARKSMPAKDLRDLIDWLKANPNKASAAVVTVGLRLLATFFQRETGTQFALVPYRGAAPATQDLMAGQIDLSFDTPRTSLPLVRAESIRAYAVTSDTRLTVAPDIPTFVEMGLPAMSYSEWGGLFAPRGTPRDIIEKINAAAVEALADPAVRSRYIEFGAEIFPRERQTPEVLGALVKAGAEKWWPIIKELGIKAQ